MSNQLKQIVLHLLVILGFVVVSLAYFSPVLQGKKILQSDIMHYIGMAEQQKSFKHQTGEETYWTNSAFGGMPTYTLGAKYPHNYIKKLDLSLRFLPRPADYLFLYFCCFYILLLCLKVDYKLSAVGALAFGFSTYLIIILGVGHNAKAHAIAYMPLVLSGIIVTFRKYYFGGFILTTLALGLEIVTNHPQMTYYLLFLVIILGIAYFIDAFNKKELLHFFKSIAFLSLAAILAVGLNASGLLATKEYAKESMRGPSDLTINADGTPKAVTNGLDKDYITEYSYGISEAFNLFIPRFLGGGNYEDLGKNSETYKAYINLGASPIEALEASRHAPMYWGDQPIVEAPAYIGAVVVFLFVLGLFLVHGRVKWWLVSGASLSLLLSFGKNLNVLTDFFIDYVPLYDKFRAVSSIQVILELCVSILGILALAHFFNTEKAPATKLKALKYSAIIIAGLCLVFLIFKTLFFDFESYRDDFYLQNYGKPFVSALIEDRKTLFTSDTLRTLTLVLCSAGLLYFVLKKKITKNIAIVVFALLIVVDLVSFNKNYVNNDDFVSALQVDKPYKITSVDNDILKDKSHYRVLDMSLNGQRQPARASYFHNSILGYSAVKLGRYNELLDFHIYKNNPNVLNMLNTKYIIADKDQQTLSFTNDEANGNAWFVSQLLMVDSANTEIMALDSLDTKSIAVSSMQIPDLNDSLKFQVDSLASVVLKEFTPNYLKYTSSNSKDGFVVFSEIFYKEGWNAYIDGNITPHYNVNYVLRGLPVPRGHHVIEFKFEPNVVKQGSRIALISSILVGLLLFSGGVYAFKRTKL